MTSLAEHARRAMSRRKTSTILLAIIIAVIAIVGIYLPWQEYKTHNVFDAIMAAEWQDARDAWQDPSPNVILVSKYKRVIVPADHHPHYVQQLHYDALIDNATDNTQIDIKPAHNPDDCTNSVCVSSWWSNKFPRTLSLSSTVWGLESTDFTFIAVVIDYDTHTRHLTEYVAASSHYQDVTGDTEIAAMLAQNGITNQELQERRDWLLYDQFLPDFLAAHPTINYTASNWGDVTVTTDQFLS